jgi:EAL domain-containing protein (putative c-di-GMP-specific phosphodiesterase class I)
MRPIDEWVLREACRQAKHWCDTLAQPLRVAINLSPQTFRDPHLSRLVLRALGETGLPPELLDLELTENVLLDEGQVTSREVATLHAHGVRLSIDDFGTGYSSMARLSSLHIDTLKIDRSFITDLGDRNNMAIVRAIVGLGQALNIEVLAEGVETDDQLEWVREVGCGLVQGFVTGRPMSAKHIELYLQNEGETALEIAAEAHLRGRSV